ncbi:DUF2637 domain-containing protein [Streptomyces sp. cmx-4-7]|uniref:DUF2637 domain-containing protein n=1 Tax=Streptomyces sp. cmx-4-7 TaxID=2790939 RepID=UPI0039800909
MNRAGRIALVIGLVAVVLMAFRVSWNALSDVARAIGADPTAALLYPIVVDGLMALALVAALVLTGADRKFALRVLATYTVASLLLNYVHGLVPALHTDSIRWGRLTDLDYANWALVLLATSLPVGSIYFGSDLVAKVLHHNAESADSSETTSGQSALVKATEAPASGPAKGGESAPAARPHRSATVPGSTGATRRRATGPVPAAAKSTTGHTRTDVDLLDKARLLTAGWSDDRLTAERLRSELRIGQKRARILRDRLQAERTSQARSTEGDDPEAGPPEGVAEATPIVTI